MRMFYQMMQSQGQDVPSGIDLKDNTLELNAAHPLIVNLNQIRKANPKRASLIARTMAENAMMQSNIQFNTDESIVR